MSIWKRVAALERALDVVVELSEQLDDFGRRFVTLEESSAIERQELRDDVREMRRTLDQLMIRGIGDQREDSPGVLKLIEAEQDPEDELTEEEMELLKKDQAWLRRYLSGDFDG